MLVSKVASSVGYRTVNSIILTSLWWLTSDHAEQFYKQDEYSRCDVTMVALPVLHSTAHCPQKSVPTCFFPENKSTDCVDSFFTLDFAVKNFYDRWGDSTSQTPPSGCWCAWQLLHRRIKKQTRTLKCIAGSCCHTYQHQLSTPWTQHFRCRVLYEGSRLKLFSKELAWQLTASINTEGAESITACDGFHGSSSVDSDAQTDKSVLNYVWCKYNIIIIF